MDGKFSVFRLQRVLIDVVDHEWAADTLSDDEVILPADELPVSDDIDAIDVDMEPSKKDNDDTWQDLNLQQLLDEPSTVSNSTGPNP